MARKRALSAREVDALRDVGMHWISDNLYIQIREQGTRSWLFRYWVDGKPKVIGLGPVRDVPLAKARDQAERLRIQIRDGADPAADRKAAKAQKKVDRSVAEAARVPTFQDCAREYINSHEASWSNDKHRQQWSSTLKMCVYPVFGKKPVSEIGIDDILKVLKPIWTTKPPTAGNIRGRIDKILGWATAMGYRTGDNPASRDGPLMHLLPSLNKLQRQHKHHAAVPYKEVAAVVADIRKLDSTSANALLFTILTAVRTGETLGATWDEIDLEAKLWTIPAERMKARTEHQVPLAMETLALLNSLPRDPTRTSSPASGSRHCPTWRCCNACAAFAMMAPPCMGSAPPSPPGHGSRPTILRRSSRRLSPIPRATRWSPRMPARSSSTGGGR